MKPSCKSQTDSLIIAFISVYLILEHREEVQVRLKQMGRHEQHNIIMITDKNYKLRKFTLQSIFTQSFKELFYFSAWLSKQKTECNEPICIGLRMKKRVCNKVFKKVLS